jgi:hypothetical protein
LRVRARPAGIRTARHCIPRLHLLGLTFFDGNSPRIGNLIVTSLRSAVAI